MAAAPQLPTAPALPRVGTGGKFLPQVEGFVVVQLPGETLRCPVRRVVSDDAVLVEITSPPVSRAHFFRFGDVIGCRRRVVNSRDVWEAQPEREFLAEQQKLIEAERARKPAALKKAMAKKKGVRK